MFLNVLLLALSLHLSYSYVLLQVSKNDKNQSDVKAYVHKVMHPPETQGRRDRSNNKEKVRRFEIKKRAEEDDERTQNMRRQETVMLINQAFDALKNMANGPEFRASQTMSFVDKALDLAKSYVNGPAFRSSKTMKYVEKVIDIVKEVADGPEYSSRSGNRAPNMKTEIVRFQGNQPSLVFELKPNFFVDFVKKILSTQLVERYMDDMGISTDDSSNYQNPQHFYKKKYPSKYSKYTK